MHASDGELDVALDAARAGDGRGFDAIFRALGAPVAGYLRARGVHDPDDVANAVFLRTFRALHTFQGNGERFRSWLFTIAHHASIDDRRRRARRVLETDLDAVSVEPAGGADEVAYAVFARLAAERVDALLARLSPDQCDVLVLRIVADLSVDQTAAVVGKSYEAVKALQRRGLAALKRELSADEAVPR
ncbi:MAG TPA: RNA polymerase sigma factor [Acidimicrobiia bacterium]